MSYNVNLQKLIITHKSHVKETTNLLTGALPNQVRNRQTSRFVWVPCQNPGKSSREDSVGYTVVIGGDGERVAAQEENRAIG